MAKTGRPKSDNPKTKVIGLKLTEDETARLREYASKHDMTITQVLLTGIEMQYAMEEAVGTGSLSYSKERSKFGTVKKGQ